MPKKAWSGSGNVVESIGFTVSAGQLRRAPKPPHPYGSPAADLKREEAEAAQRALEAGNKASDEK